MNIDEVCTLLDKENPYHESLTAALDTLRIASVLFERKDIW